MKKFFELGRISVSKSYHISEKRDKSLYSRDAFLTTERYKQILSKAVEQGLMKNNGLVAIGLYDEEARKHTLLVNVTTPTSIFIITTMYSKKNKHIPHFVDVKNRLNLDWVMGISQEDDEFLKAMQWMS